MPEPTTEDVLDSAAEASSLANLTALLRQVGEHFYNRQWVMGTSGNFSAVVSEDPLRLVITASGADKGSLAPEHFMEVDESGRIINGQGSPSAETEVHLTVIRARRARAVLHTHSVWSTIISESYAKEGGIYIENYEMLKGLSGVRTHEHREWLPIIENSQRWSDVTPQIAEMLCSRPDIHGFLILRHGLYTWGESIIEAKRHVEILEFLLEVMGRSYCSGRDSQPNIVS
ncbi:MAG: methylthioribulose-phosphate dehydratase [Acidobacteriota bacterium]|jgi:methylthioribulose-1-phosphate dehydratase|nr:methylthioribulose-phosphate dehydratase [Acidobacteriota bacterium]